MRGVRRKRSPDDAIEKKAVQEKVTTKGLKSPENEREPKPKSRKEDAEEPGPKILGKESNILWKL